MKPTKLLEKEAVTARHRLPALVGLLVLLPAAFAGASLVFDDVLPRDSPIAVVPGDEDVTAEELEDAAAVLSLFADATAFDGDHVRALEREDYYLAVAVPSDFTEPGGTVVVHHHGAVVPFDEPSRLLVSALDGGFRAFGTGLSAERNTVGEEIDLSEYLFPVMLVALVFVLGLMYLPHDLRRERKALDRVTLDTSVFAVAATKIAFYTVLLALPVLVFQTISKYYGYTVELFTVPVAAFVAVTFVYTACVGTSVALATGFSAYGRLVNATLLFGVVVLSNLVYPVGFFSSTRGEIARALPTHYSAVAVRSHSTKDVSSTLFLDRFLLLLAFTIVTVLLLYGASRRYERR